MFAILSVAHLPPTSSIHVIDANIADSKDGQKQSRSFSKALQHITECNTRKPRTSHTERGADL
jgi:hypothetical protein